MPWDTGNTGDLPPPSQPSTASGSGGGETGTQIGGEAAAAPKRDASDEAKGEVKRPRFLDDETLVLDLWDDEFFECTSEVSEGSPGVCPLTCGPGLGEGTPGGGDLSHVTSHDALGECLDLLMLASTTKFQDECPNGSISEVYSPPRVVLEATRYGLRP